MPATTADLVIRWAPIPGTPQEPFWDDDTADANVLLRGGWGSGKTMTLWGKVLKLSAINAPTRGMWTVPHYGHIHDTILPLLEETDDQGRPWFLGTRGGLWDYHETRHVLTWAGGGPIHFFSAENPASIAGPSMAYAAVDEPGQISYAAWRNTVARVRHAGARLRQKVAAGTNEGLGWLSDMFGPDREPHCHVYQMDTRQNVELMQRDPHYIREIMAHATEAEIASYIGGGVANLTGALAYPTFAAETHWSRDVPTADPRHPLVATFDFNVDPMVCLLGQRRAGPHGVEAHVVDAVILYGGSTVDQTCTELLARYPEWRAGWEVYGDATGADRHVKSLRSNYDMIRERLLTSGPVRIRVPRANPPVARRLNAVNRMLRNALGQTRLYIRRTDPPRQCTTRDVVRSLERTQKKSGTDDVLKKPGETITHPGEALGYWIDYEWPATRPQPLAASITAASGARQPSQTLQAIRRRKRAAAQ